MGLLPFCQTIKEKKKHFNFFFRFHSCHFQKLFFFVWTYHTLRQNAWPPWEAAAPTAVWANGKHWAKALVACRVTGARESLEQLTCSLSPLNIRLLAALQLSAELARSPRLENSGNYCITLMLGRSSVIMWNINDREKKNTSCPLRFVTLSFSFCPWRLESTLSSFSSVRGVLKSDLCCTWKIKCGRRNWCLVGKWNTIIYGTVKCIMCELQNYMQCFMCLTPFTLYHMSPFTFCHTIRLLFPWLTRFFREKEPQRASTIQMYTLKNGIFLLQF